MSSLSVITFVVILVLYFDNNNAAIRRRMTIPYFLKGGENRLFTRQKEFTFKYSDTISLDTIESIVSLHNEEREELFNGLNGKPKPTFMYELEWSRPLAKISDKRAKQCKCIPPERRYNFIGTIVSCSNTDETFPDVIKDWIFDGKFLKFDKYYRLQAFARKNKFVQMASGTNYAVGCSYATCYNKKKKSELRHVYVCSYEIGVFHQNHIYDTHPWAKNKCSLGYSRDYPNLCLHDLPPVPEKDNWKKPKKEEYDDDKAAKGKTWEEKVEEKVDDVKDDDDNDDAKEDDDNEVDGNH